MRKLFVLSNLPSKGERSNRRQLALQQARIYPHQLYKMSRESLLDQVGLLLALQFISPILGEILEDLANLVTDSWETLSSKKSSSLSQSTNALEEFLDCSSRFSTSSE